MTRAVAELRQIPFGYLIGSPMKAAIEAQALAAKTTIEFIEKVGFIPPDKDQDMLFIDETKDADGGKVRNVTFEYKKTDENGVSKDVSLTVPILAIVPIPYLRLDEMTIDFTAKLEDQIANNTSSTFKLDSSVKGTYKSWWSPLSLEMRTSMSYQNSRQTASRYTREYTMKIHVRAVQDDIPAGLERVLDLLEQTIKEKPATP
ncbi:MAG: DUF2589 domain-containing protein [Dongiaceae bacterium]